MDQYKEYLADQVVGQSQLITFRALSRALNVPANTAKECLYEFHRTHKAKSPQSIHATYLVFGTLKEPPACSQDGDSDADVSTTPATGNPFSESVPVETAILVTEHDLEKTLRRCQLVHSVHVYSVGLGTIRDLRLLSDPAEELIGQTPVDELDLYGTIVNPKMHRRAGGPKLAARPKSAPDHPEPAPEKQALSKPSRSVKAFFTAPSQKSQVSEPHEDENSKPDSQSQETAAKKPAAPPEMRGGIVSAFAKTRPPAEKKAVPTPLSDDGEDDSEPIPVAWEKKKIGSKAAAGLSRQERQAQLRRMMEDDDNEEKEEDTPNESEEDDHMENSNPEPELKLEDAEPESDKEVAKEQEQGKRRGRRRIVRKKQVMDDEGFLVTKREEVWESFSEAEEDTKGSTPGKGKLPVAGKPKTGSKKGGAAKSTTQGSITSFFGKK